MLTSRPWGHRVYPRVCGGTALPITVTSLAKGLSPRVRGNLLHSQVSPGRLGSIPACAGEPGSLPSTRILIRVYPRVCGGTVCLEICVGDSAGLSPRVRGEPTAAGSPDWIRRVYPRVCGGTVMNARGTNAAPGLSPRVRGNRQRAG